MAEHCLPWSPVEGITAPCADIDYSYNHLGSVRVLMRFSIVEHGLDNDLELVFRDVVGLRWAPEHFGSILSPMPQPLPKCQSSRWSKWTFPLLRIVESQWLLPYKQLPGTERREHFSLGKL